ncbi:MAG TPA: ATP-dependent 6-phosphofructokinase [Thermoanaerobaculia bacterium]|jgi:6-phosphofructokinase 1
MPKKIGILTGGGDCPGLNAVIRAAVRTLSRDYDLEVVGIQSGFEGLLTDHIIPLTPESIRGILPKGGTLLRTTNRGNPFEYPVGGPGSACVDRSAEVVENIHRLGIDGIIAIGGDGTLKIAQRLCDMGIPMVAVPKTIDNDLEATDYTFGFHTAVAVATDAVDRLHTTAESHDRVMILEVMGRNAGWIALYSGLAGGADIILIPEIEYDPQSIVRSIRERQQEGSKFDIIVVAEGAKRVGGEESYLDKASRRLGGIAYQVAADIQQHIDLEIRVTVLGHIQRGGSPIAFDRILASRYGKAAADLVATGEYGQMVALREEKIVAVPIRDAVSRQKSVDPQGEVVKTALSLGISFGDGR